MAWRPAASLPVWHRQLKAGSRAAPPATAVDAWGMLGDAAHDPMSDHTPHDFPGWGNDIVTAADFPNRPDLGLDAHRVLDDIRRARDARAKYGISNGEIFSNHQVTENGHTYPAWTWRPYGGSDRHFTHGHLSVVGDSRADGTQPWPTIGGDMEQAEQVKGNQSKGNTVGDVFADVSNERDWWYGAPGATTKNPPPVGSRADLLMRGVQQALIDLSALTAKVDAIQAGQVSQDALNTAVLAALQTPAVRAVLVDAAYKGANLSEDS